ncbi:cora-domain-containing protein [Massarina eburnea CBS 473.64]|uniref:Cora-domain-containing protein n=1 Tax=Massarina eburnea CBS 473.64 TaxID=1395130 RepID=A0A6A6RWK7_9PLEO|nr:cora-domain-containing protein [Massarina eburnea CBS 473.64]
MASNATTTDAQASSSHAQVAAQPEPEKKRKKHRGGKKRRNRRQSFAATAGTLDRDDTTTDDARPSLANIANETSRGSSSFYRLRSKRSNDSLESDEALLDHRDQPPSLQPRRQSVQMQQTPTMQRRPVSYGFGRSALSHQQRPSDSDQDDDDDDDANDHTPLMSASARDIRTSNGYSYGGTSTQSSQIRQRRGSKSSRSSGKRAVPFTMQHHSQTNLDEYDVNNPPSVPASPVLGPETTYGDVMLHADMDERTSPPGTRHSSRDVLIDIDEEPATPHFAPFESAPASPPAPTDFRRRMTIQQAAKDVCFPQDGMSEIGQEDYISRPEAGDLRGRRRRRRWPELGVLEAWSHEEKEQRSIEGMRARKVSEPLMVEGRLRPQKRVWHRDVEETPYRFTYFNEEFENTIHSQTISELVQPGQTFRNLFVPDPPIIEDSTDDETDTDDDTIPRRDPTLERPSMNGLLRTGARTPARLDPKQTSSGEETRSNTPGRTPTPKPGQEKPKRYGPRPAFWLDVLSPTDAEMKVIAKAFGIHPLTAEDILMQEQREKVELFKHYYFINYRTFEQDENSEDYLEPINLYVVVFREGVISFHFSLTPHPANVRRRIRQLKDYLILSPDWISYAIIDDITDAYAPLSQRIEEEVDDIDEAILRSYASADEHESKSKKQNSSLFNNPLYEKVPEGKTNQEGGRDMLRRVGECRKKVMSLYRLLSTKADVIKGFAKRCTEQWEVAPRSEIGLYLGDIQDHIVTMTANLSHYETLLSRAHSNYLAHVNIRMNERQEKTSDILGKLTVMGTIVLPMNVVTGIWGMNCLVPGQDIENLNWFWCITSGLILFGTLCYLIAKRVYGIV